MRLNYTRDRSPEFTLAEVNDMLLMMGILVRAMVMAGNLIF